MRVAEQLPSVPRQLSSGIAEPPHNNDRLPSRGSVSIEYSSVNFTASPLSNALGVASRVQFGPGCCTSRLHACVASIVETIVFEPLVVNACLNAHTCAPDSALHCRGVTGVPPNVVSSSAALPA